ncbi:MAG: GntR family transcriptional regulator [Clostridiales bacterium]|nr:GntR family transcriptional regulator [Clostridiales bacterium]
MFQIDLKSRKAIYEQVVDNFKRLITTGALREHDKVPSIRDLARSLDVNPNTVQKAYRELETQGYFYTVLGQGNFIASPSTNDDKAVQTRLNAVGELVRELIYHGVSKEEIIKFIESLD